MGYSGKTLVFRLPRYFIDHMEEYSHAQFLVIAGICATFRRDVFLTKEMNWGLIGSIIGRHPDNVSRHFRSIKNPPWTVRRAAWRPDKPFRRDRIIDMTALPYEYDVVDQGWLKKGGGVLKVWLLRKRSVNQIQKLTGVRWAEVRAFKNYYGEIYGRGKEEATGEEGRDEVCDGSQAIQQAYETLGLSP